MLRYGIGLDIGITSVGWAVLSLNGKDEPNSIVDLGVRIFDKAEHPKTGASLAKPRRDARSQRRRIRRKAHRIERVENLLAGRGIIDVEAFKKRYYQKGLPDVYQLRYDALNKRISNDELAQILVYMVKHRGFKSNRKSEVKDSEMGKLLNGVKENELILNENGYRTIGEMIYLDDKFRNKKYGDGEADYISARNKEGDYSHCIARDLLVQEIREIFNAQRILGNKSADEKLENDFLEIMLSQRSFDLGPGNMPNGNPSPYAGNLIEKMIGNCTFEKNEKRAAKATYTAERFVLLQTINNICVIDEMGDSRFLTEDEKRIVIDMAYNRATVSYSNIRSRLKLNEKEYFKGLNYGNGKELQSVIKNINIVDEKGNVRSLKSNEKDKISHLAVERDFISYTDVRNELRLSEEEIFIGLKYDEDKKCEKKKLYEYKKCESKILIELKYWNDIKTVFKLNYQEISDENIIQLDQIGTVLSCYKTDDLRREKLSELNINDEIITKLLELDYSRYNRLSIKTMKRIIPYLEQGFVYSEACDKAGYYIKNNYNLNKKLKSEDIYNSLNEITNPVVRRSVVQTIKVINAIIDAYGSPVFICVELAREMSKNIKERLEIKKQQDENEKNNNQIIEQIREYGIAFPKGQDIVKLKLWKEQDGYDPYTGTEIKIEDLFIDNKYQVDHILPYSRSFDDSYNNKVVVATAANQEKGNRTPYEWMSMGANSYGVTWDTFRVSVNSWFHSLKKRQHLLKEKYGYEEEKAFKERNLNDTRYITTYVMNLIRNHLIFEDYINISKKQHVFSVNGYVTGYMRKRWGLDKSRDNDRHHAQDAVVIACTTPGVIKAVSDYVKGRELRYSYNIEYIDKETGEIIRPKDYSREEWDKRFGIRFPEPWKYFRDELEMRMSTKPEKLLDDLLKKGYTVSRDYIRVHTTNDETLNKLGLWTGSVSPFFVSRMQNHKIRGQAHKETIASPKIFKTEGKVIQKVALSKLKLKNGVITDGNGGYYYNPQDDRLLYDALVDRLYQFDGDGKKAFLEPFYKPKSDGSKGPIVKKVKIESVQSVGVYTGKINENATGIASAGRMIRIDIYKENGKYYMVPIYTSDVVGDKLPNKAVVTHKNACDWREMKEDNFLFSIYSRDVICIKEKNKNEIIGYYYASNISTATISIRKDDGSKYDNNKIELEKGIQNLLQIQKYEVDILGRLSKIRIPEKRQGFTIE